MPVTDPMGARILVYNTVADWLAGPPVNLAQSVETGRTFIGGPPGGYGLTEGNFLRMCDDISVLLSKATQRTLTLTGQWRVQHERDVLSTFMNAVAVELLAAQLTPGGKDAHAWAMS